MKYAFILLAALTASSAMAGTPGAAPVPASGWLGLGYTYNATNTSTGRMVWLFVRQIAPGGPADRAGLKTQDVITAINGKKITFKDELDTLNFFSGIHQGDRVQLKVSRGKTVQTLNIVAGPLPSDMVKRRRLNEEVAKSQRAAPK
jgi:S1-C subfamily serine protease